MAGCGFCVRKLSFREALKYEPPHRARIAVVDAVNLNSIHFASMKKALLFIGSILLFAACTEKGFDVVPRAEFDDTTYMAAVEPAQPRTIIIEEFTGVTCPNCPRGHIEVAKIQAQYPNRVLAVSLYYDGLGQTRPVEGVTRQNFRTKDATNLADGIFGGVSALPSASIDRVPVGGITLPSFVGWSGAVETRTGIPSPANVQVTSEYDTGTRTATIHLRVAYTSTVTKKHAVTLLLTEDSLVDAQEYPDRIDTFYNFKHVMRDAITAPTGDPMLDGTSKDAGRVYERTFVYPVNAEWNARQCKLIAIVHNTESGDKEVLQAAESKLVE